MTDTLKLRAESEEEIGILSSALQDAITRVGDIRYNASGHSLTLRLSRYRHEAQDVSQRILTGVRVDGVLSLKSKGIDRSDPEAMTVLLALEFAPGDTEPGGHLKFIFAGGGEMAAAVECIDVTLADVSMPRDTDKQPLHPVGE